MKKKLTLNRLQSPEHDSGSSAREIRCSVGERDVAIIELRIEIAANHPLRELAQCILNRSGPQFELATQLQRLLDQRRP